MTYTERVAKFLRRNRRRWVNARSLMRVGGQCAWRTRIADARREHAMVIENRVRQVGRYRLSEYRYVGKAA